jgi:hypothetical protein
MGRLPPAKWSADLAWYLEHLERFYGSIRRVTGCRVIVDASKWPMYSHMLDRLPSLDPHVVHLVRDPRAVAYSWTRRKEFQPGVLLPRQHPVKTTAYWIVLNPAIRNLWAGRPERYRFLRYRQFATRPREVVEGLLEFVGEPGADLPFLDGNTVRIDPTHAVAGNVVRLRHGGVKLRVDDEWDGPEPMLSPEKRGEIVQYLQEQTVKLLAHQHDDGFWNNQWPTATPASLEPTETIGDRLGDRIIATGHALEWWALLPERDRDEILPPTRKPLIDASKWLVRTINELDEEKVAEYGPFLSHAGRALALWRGKFPDQVDLNPKADTIDKPAAH